MADDFIEMGAQVQVIPTSRSEELRSVVEESRFAGAVVNTLMRAPCATLCAELGVPNVFVVHESIEPDNLEVCINGCLVHSLPGARARAYAPWP